MRLFLMNTVNFELGTYLSYLYEKVVQLNLGLGWLQSPVLLAPAAVPVLGCPQLLAHLLWSRTSLY